jgi:hypothetical protein
MIRKVIAIKNKIKLMDIENIYFDDWNIISFINSFLTNIKLFVEPH